MSSKISWMVYEDETYLPYNTYMADGTYTTDDVIVRRIQVWNNYQGSSSVDDVKDAKLVLAFKKFEDNFLLNLITIRLVHENVILEPTFDTDRAIYDFGTLYGNAGGYCKEIEITIGPLPANLQSELKSLIFYLDY